MQRKSKICGYIVVFCFAILPVLFLSLFLQTREQGKARNSQYYAKKLKIAIESENSSIYISAWKSEVDQQYYLFLPSYVDPENAHVVVEEIEESLIFVDGSQWTKETRIADMERGTSYPIEFRNDSQEILDKSSIVVYQSEHLATAHIDTSTGSTHYVNGSKETKEEGVLTLITEDGEVNYEGQLSYVKGRGNATWEYPKKPYSIQLKQKENLLGLGTGDTWSLLANWADNSFIRNKIAYDLGEGVGLDTTNAKFVDLFLNGEYNGTYQLTEKVEAPGYLLEMEILERWKEEPKGFRTESGQAIVVKTPENISYDEVDELANKFQQLEDAILAENGVDLKSGRHYSQIIDVSSWVKVYLVQEVMQNYDAYVSSLFMYTKDWQKSPIFCGPIWDFDWTLIARDGTEAHVLTANQSRHPFTNYWLPSLYKKPEFQQAIVEEYKTIFLPVLTDITERKIPIYRETLRGSMEMNAKRWNKQTVEQWQESISEVSDYLNRRTESLLEIWNTPEQFYKVHLECDSDSFGKMDYYVKQGERCENVPEGLEKEGYEFAGWYVVGSDEEFDISEPIYGDAEIEARWTEIAVKSPVVKWIKQEVLQIRYILSGMLLMGLMGLMICDIRRNNKKRDG